MISINYRDPRPVYEQIMGEIRKLIISGVYQTDEKLPSVRELAQQLAINPNTIQRAYRELERSGYIYSVPGKGNFAGAHQEVDSARKEELLSTLKEAARELRYLGMTEQELFEAIRDDEGGRKKHD